LATPGGLSIRFTFLRDIDWAPPVFYQQSRAFDRMQHFIGGEPYFYFTVLAAVYKEFLVSRAAEALSELQPGKLIEASPFDSTKAKLISHHRIFAGYLGPMIPNLFRYTRRGFYSIISMIDVELRSGARR
jgi:hypothetical protein